MAIDLYSIWKKLENIDYIILRNYRDLQEEVDAGGDIDLLCDDWRKMAMILGLKPRFDVDNVYNFKTNVGGANIPIDVRRVGDNYYDKKWEADMLKRKGKRENYYVIGEYDEKYSLLYHILLHKKKIPLKYNQFLNENFGRQDVEQLITNLARYMSENQYQPVIPNDKGVDFNRDNYMKLLSRIS